MKHNIYIYILIMAVVTYLIRVLPLTLIRKEIKNKTIRSFLYYVPYVTLAVMTFPAILDATQSTWSGLCGCLPAGTADAVDVICLENGSRTINVRKDKIMRRKIRTIGIILVCIIIAGSIFVMSPLFPYVRSLAVMAVYSHVCKEDSIMEKEGFDVQIPGGGATNETDWYPFVMTFTADQEFSNYIGKQGEKLTILYNFPAFNLSKGCSRLYDTKSPYYNGFYGAYLVQQEDGSA